MSFTSQLQYMKQYFQIDLKLSENFCSPISEQCITFYSVVTDNFAIIKRPLSIESQVMISHIWTKEDATHSDIRLSEGVPSLTLPWISGVKHAGIVYCLDITMTTWSMLHNRIYGGTKYKISGRIAIASIRLMARDDIHSYRVHKSRAVGIQESHSVNVSRIFICIRYRIVISKTVTQLTGGGIPQSSVADM